jgi:hypothetical protein
MAETEKDKVWVSALVEKDLVKILDRMVVENGSDRAKFVRLLIEQEAVRRGHVATGSKKNRVTDRELAGSYPTR